MRLAPELRTVRSIAGATPSSSVTIVPGGFITGYSSVSRAPVLVEYEHGLDEPPMDARLAGLRLAKAWLVQGPFDSRTTIISSPDSGITATLAVPGRGGSIWGVPDVDSYVQSNRLIGAA